MSLTVTAHAAQAAIEAMAEERKLLGPAFKPTGKPRSGPTKSIMFHQAGPQLA